MCIRDRTRNSIYLHTKGPGPPQTIKFPPNPPGRARLGARDLARAVGAAALLLVVVLAASIRHDAHCERGGEEDAETAASLARQALAARLPRKTAEAYRRLWPRLEKAAVQMENHAEQLYAKAGASRAKAKAMPRSEEQGVVPLDRARELQEYAQRPEEEQSRIYHIAGRLTVTYNHDDPAFFIPCGWPM